MNQKATATTTKKTLRPRTWLAYLGLGVVWTGAEVLSIATSDAVTTSKIKLSATQVHVINTIFALPALLILLTILFAGLSIWRYARAIAGSKEDKGFRFVAYGIFALLAGLLVGSCCSSFRQVAAHHAANPQHVKVVFVIIANYISVAAALITYSLLLYGSRLLLRCASARTRARRCSTSNSVTRRAGRQ